jgi:hypothetical protein
MGFRDEEILNEKKAAAYQKINELEEKKLEKELNESIYDDCIHVDDLEIRFGRREFADIGISLYMPESFAVMDEETKKTLYPFGNPPQYVLVDYDIPFQMTLNKTGHKVPDEDMERFIEMTAKLMENYGPKTKLLGKGVIREKEHNIGIIEVVTRAMDNTNVHNVMYNVSVNGEIVMGNIHFATKYSKRLSVVAKEIIDSIEYPDTDREE